MSLLKFIKAQLGISNTPANNFTLDASAQDGTMKLSRGNAGATTQDVLVVDAAGKVTFPAGSEMIGVGQTWQDVKASRALGTTYNNTTGKPIAIAVTAIVSAAGNALIVLVGGTKTDHASVNASSGLSSVTSVVPPGQTYQVIGTNYTLEAWSELR